MKSFWRSRVLAFVLFGLALLVIFTAIPRLTDQFRKPDKPNYEYPAPDFTLVSLEGQSISLHQEKGKPVVLVFVASWCEVCRKEMPMMVDTYLAHRPHDVLFLAVDSFEERGPVEQFRDEFKIPFPMLLDADGKVADLYEIKGTPTNLFIDRDGTVQDLVIGGLLSRTYLEKEIAPLVASSLW